MQDGEEAEMFMESEWVNQAVSGKKLCSMKGGLVQQMDREVRRDRSNRVAGKPQKSAKF